MEINNNNNNKKKNNNTMGIYIHGTNLPVFHIFYKACNNFFFFFLKYILKERTRKKQKRKNKEQNFSSSANWDYFFQKLASAIYGLDAFFSWY